MAVLDVAGFVADLKDHAVEHGFHVHDERHFVESYSLRQTWEVDLHPEEGCEGPVDLYLSLEIDPRVLLGFEDAVIEVGDDAEPEDTFHFPLSFTWALPPLAHGPDLLVLATDLAGVGGRDLPLDVSATDSFPAATDAPERSLRIVAHQTRLAHRHPAGRGSPVRHARGVPRGEPLPARPGRRLARLSATVALPAAQVPWVRGHAHRLPALREPHLRVG